MKLEYKFTVDDLEETVGTFTIEASDRCLVVYTPIHPDRFKLMRYSTLEHYRHHVVHAAKQNGGHLNTEELEAVFDKEIFVNKLRYEGF